jgi:hypothetical protein
MDDILDIKEEDSRKLVVAIDKAIRPDIKSFENFSDVQRVVAYYEALEHAFRKVGLSLSTKLPAKIQFENGPSIYAALKTEIDKLKIDILIEKKSVELDNSWRDKIHTYLEHIRKIVEQANLTPAIRERILKCLTALADEVNRNRAPIQKFTEALVAVCEGIAEGADKLNPAVRLLERVIGAVEKLRRSEKPTLSLPKPEDFGLPDKAESESQH